jgi:hypothetical protein
MAPILCSLVFDTLEPLSYGNNHAIRRHYGIASQVFAHPPDGLATDISLKTPNTALAEMENDTALVVINFLAKSLEPFDN